MDRNEKQRFWQQHLADWSSSGLSQKAYCAQHSLKLANFQYWRQRLRSSGQTQSQFIAISTPAHAASVRLMAAGVQIDVPVDALEQVLPVVWRSLRATS